MNYNSDNIFAKIIRKEIPADVVYEDKHILAFRDITPAAPTHVLVIPKGDYSSFDDFAQTSSADEVAYFFLKVQEIAASLEVDKTGYRLITNHGSDASQSVPHFHVHILAGRPLGGLVPGDASAR